MENRKITHGGLRKGAGAKPKPYKTKTIAFRVREQWVSIIKATVKKKIDQLKKVKRQK
jgi:hypothetical protein